MSTDDRMETITDPEQIRATDEPDPFRRNPVRHGGPDDPRRLTGFVEGASECVIVRDEYDEPAPFGSCATHRRALSSPVALGCTTPAPVGAAVALDLDAIEVRRQQALAGPYSITGPSVVVRALEAGPEKDIPALVAEVRRLTEEVEVRALGSEQCCFDACDGGACETCPGCCAGWCVNGHDFAVDEWDTLSDEDREQWWSVAREHNAGIEGALARAESAESVVGTLRARLAAVEALRPKLLAELRFIWTAVDGRQYREAHEVIDYVEQWFLVEDRAALAVTTGEGE